MKDWLDFGDEDVTTGINGAEDDYYTALEEPYSCGNGPLRHFDELLMIKNISTEMINREEYGYRLRDLLSVYGMNSTSGESGESGENQAQGFSFPGKININTAELPVIMALLPDNRSDLENSVTAQAIVDFRDEKTEDGFVNTLGKNWYDSCPGCEDNGIDKGLIAEKSNTFIIRSTAEVNKTVLEVIAVIRREDKKGEYTVLSWKTN
jgi:general secretion pathway protein K